MGPAERILFEDRVGFAGEIPVGVEHEFDALAEVFFAERWRIGA